MLLNSIYTLTNTFSASQAGAEKLKQKALDEYKLALLMPRKKKKKAKKSAIMLYNIACWEPFK